MVDPAVMRSSGAVPYETFKVALDELLAKAEH
jgi:hypothetical protein